MVDQAGRLPLAVQAAHVVLVAHVVVDREKVGVGQHQCILDEENSRNESLLAVVDMVAEAAFAVHRTRDQECDQAAAGDDVCRYLDDHTDLLLVEERREPLAYLQARHQQDHHFELRMPMLQVRQSAR